VSDRPDLRVVDDPDLLAEATELAEQARAFKSELIAFLIELEEGDEDA
jgi:hypothetical protein